MFLLSERFNFTISSFGRFGLSPLFSTRVPVTSENIPDFRIWLSYYTAQDEFGFMSASLHTDVILSDVYFEPLALSAWLLVISTAGSLSILLTSVKLFRQTLKSNVMRSVYNIIMVAKNLIDQPTSTNDTNGLQLRVTTLIMCLWCFGCMHANHAYKTAVFSGSHFRQRNYYPTTANEMRKSSWEKYSTKSY